MRTLTKILAGTAIVAALAAASAASANTVTIRIVYDGVDQNLTYGVTPGYTEVNDQATFNGVIGVFQLNNIGGVFDNDPLLSAQSQNTVKSTAAGTHTLDVFVTGYGYTVPTGPGAGFLSTFQTNTLSAGWTLQESTWLSVANIDPAVDPSRVLLGTTPLMNGPTTSTAFVTTYTNPGALYSLATEYHIVSNGQGQSNSNITIANAVPEPAAWALMIMGFGGVGAMVRSRRRQATFA